MKKTHNHHIIPRHAGGTDDPSNLIELTVEEHAEEHRKLFEKYGRWEDELAWKAISGQVPSYQVAQLARRYAQLGRKATKEAKEKQSMAKIGNKNALGNKARLGQPHTEKTKKKISLAKTGEKNPQWGKFGLANSFGGKTHDEETRKRIGDAVRLGHARRREILNNTTK